MTALRFIKPLDKIELGVAEIINGNIDYQFRPVGPDFEGLSNGLNVMLARLLGREEPNEDEPEEEQDETARWRSDQMLVEEGSGPDRRAVARGERAGPGERADLLRAHLQRVRRGAEEPGQADQGDHRPGLHRQAAPDRGRPQAEVEVPHGPLQGQRPGRAGHAEADPDQLDRSHRAAACSPAYECRRARSDRSRRSRAASGWTCCAGGGWACSAIRPASPRDLIHIVDRLIAGRACGRRGCSGPSTACAARRRT